jgi:hypothetical protein
MASIASNFSRRSPSFSSISNIRSEDYHGSRVHRVSQGNLRAASASDRRPAPAVVDFHNAPAAFLPTDFELQDIRPSSRRRRLANRAGGTERSTERPTPARPKRTRRLSSHVISLAQSESNARVAARSTFHGSNAIVLRKPELAISSVKTNGNERPKMKDDRESSGSVRENSSATPSKKFLKSKSRIFKFWV